MAKAFDPAEDGATMDFDGRMSYGEYLRLDDILQAQQLRRVFALHFEVAHVAEAERRLIEVARARAPGLRVVQR